MTKVQFFSGYHGGRAYIEAHVSPLKLIEIWSGSYEGGYRVRDRIRTLLSRSPLSVQAALADPPRPGGWVARASKQVYGADREWVRYDLLL
jgi:hypothetical protein